MRSASNVVVFLNNGGGNPCKQFVPISGQNDGPDMDPSSVIMIVFLQECFVKMNFEKSTKARKYIQYAKSGK